MSVGDDRTSETALLVEQGNKNSKSGLEVPLVTDSLELCPVITPKPKTIQDRPAGVPPDQWPPAQIHLHVIACPYMAMELMDLVQ